MPNALPSDDDPNALLSEDDAIKAGHAAQAEARRIEEERKARTSAAYQELREAVEALHRDLNEDLGGLRPHEPDWDWHLQRIAKALVDACKTWRGAGYAESLFDENPPDEWDPQRKYALRVFRDTMHGASEEQVRERLQAAAVKKKRDVWRWFRDLPPEFLQKPSPAEEAPRPLTVGEYYGGQTTDPPKYGARADAGADDKQEKRVRVPENLDVLRLAKVINKARGSGRSKNEIAREFTEYDERKAQSLLRKLRDFPHLLD